MKVFNACGIIVKRHIGSFALYFIIFIALSVVMTAFSTQKFSTNFAEMKPNYTLINRDGTTPLTEGLTAYLTVRGTEVVLEDRKEALQDATFFKAVDLIAILPQGFHDAFLTSSPMTIETVVTTESAKGYYADSLVNQYLNLVRLYHAADPNLEEDAIVAAVLKDLSLEAKTEKKQFGTNAPINESYQIYSQMMCYILLVLIILCVSNISKAFRRPDLRMRNLCAPLTPRSMSMQQILCGGLLSLLAWLLLTVTGFVVYGSKLGGVDGRMIGLILLNTLVMAIVALGVASLAGSFVGGPNSQNAAANFLSLAICFLGGVFVPLEMLGEGLLTVSRFTPGYWYVTALNHICALTSFDSAALAPVWQAMLIELVFAVAIFCVSLLINKVQSQSERSFGSVRTEMEA